MGYADPTRQAAYQREWYQARKARYYERNRVRKETIREFIRSKKRRPCTDCDVEYPYYVMQFDHVRGEKTVELARLCSTGNVKQAEDEIAKCEVVCANCHAARTWQRMQVA